MYDYIIIIIFPPLCGSRVQTTQLDGLETETLLPYF